MFKPRSRTCLALALAATPLGGAVQACERTQLSNSGTAHETRFAVVGDEQGFRITPRSAPQAGSPCSACGRSVQLGAGLRLDAALFDRSIRKAGEAADAPRR